jgi:acyl-CoA thioester hydrolase
MGFVYYANYLVYFEMARADMLRETGLPYGELEKQGIFLPVVEAHCEYKSPAHYDDELEIVSRCEIQGVRLRIEYQVMRGKELIATGYTIHACVSKELKTPLREDAVPGRVIRPPASLCEALRAGPPPALQKLITPSA